jgi:hypothetical protein
MKKTDFAIALGLVTAALDAINRADNYAGVAADQALLDLSEAASNATNALRKAYAKKVESL